MKAVTKKHGGWSMIPTHSRQRSTPNSSSRVIPTIAMVCIGLLIYLSSGVSPAIASPQGKPDKVTLIVKTAKGLALAQAQAVLRGHGASPKASVAALDLHIIEVPAQAADAITKHMKGDAQILRVEEDHTRRWQGAPSD